MARASKKRVPLPAQIEPRLHSAPRNGNCNSRFATISPALYKRSGSHKTNYFARTGKKRSSGWYKPGARCKKRPAAATATLAAAPEAATPAAPPAAAAAAPEVAAPLPAPPRRPTAKRPAAAAEALAAAPEAAAPSLGLAQRQGPGPTSQSPVTPVQCLLQAAREKVRPTRRGPGPPGRRSQHQSQNSQSHSQCPLSPTAQAQFEADLDAELSGRPAAEPSAAEARLAIARTAAASRDSPAASATHCPQGNAASASNEGPESPELSASHASPESVAPLASVMASILRNVMGAWVLLWLLLRHARVWLPLAQHWPTSFSPSSLRPGMSRPLVHRVIRVARSQHCRAKAKHAEECQPCSQRPQRHLAQPRAQVSRAARLRILRLPVRVASAGSAPIKPSGPTPSSPARPAAARPEVRKQNQKGCDFHPNRTLHQIHRNSTIVRLLEVCLVALGLYCVANLILHSESVPTCSVCQRQAKVHRCVAPEQEYLDVHEELLKHSLADGVDFDRASLSSNVDQLPAATAGQGADSPATPTVNDGDFAEFLRLFNGRWHEQRAEHFCVFTYFGGRW